MSTNFPQSESLGSSCITRKENSHKRNAKTFFEIEMKFRQIFESVNNAIAIYEAVDDGTDFIIKEFNQAAEQTTHITGAVIIGRRVSEVFPDIMRFGLMEILQRVWKTGTPEYQPAKFYQDHRLKFWAENYVFKLGSGEVAAIFQDVTKYKETEERLKESDEFSRKLLEQSPNPILVQNPDTSIVYVNPACERLTGYSLSE
jgi:PAS domain S-box-containing protein